LWFLLLLFWVFFFGGEGVFIGINRSVYLIHISFMFNFSLTIELILMKIHFCSV